MPQLYMITVPGLEMKSDWATIHDRLLDEFPHITDVLATTMPATLLIVYEGRPEVDDWLREVSDALLRAGAGSRHRRIGSDAAGGGTVTSR